MLLETQENAQIKNENGTALPMQTRKQNLFLSYGWTFLVIFILISLAFLIYSPVLNHPLNNFDDLRWLEDTAIRNSFSTIFDPSLITKNPFASTYYLPLQSALYYGMVEFFGRSPIAFHGLSIGIHALTSILLYFLIFAFTQKRFISFLGSVFFVVYLGHDQSVTWTAAAFSHPLVSVFVLASVLSFLKYLKTKKRMFYVGSLFALIAGLLIRESAVVVPILLITVELLDRERNKNRIRLKDIGKVSIKFIPFFLAILPILVISADKFQHGSLNERWGGVAMGLHPIFGFFSH